MAEDKNNSDISLIELLNYFKNGIKAIFRAIFNFFKSVLNVFLQFLLVIRKNLALIGVSILIFVGIWAVLKRSYGFQNYGYDLVVKPNYYSTDALISHIKSLDDNAGTDASTEFGKSLQDISMKPIESLSDEVSSYYNVIDNDYSSSTTFRQNFNRDTVFFRQMELEDFRENITDRDYSVFKIELKTLKKWSQKELLNAITQPIEENPTFKNFRNKYLDNLKLEMTNQMKSIALIDTLLLARTNPNLIVSQDNITFDDGGNTKIMERELLMEKEAILKRVQDNSLKQIQNANVVEILSQPEEVKPNRRIKRDLPYFVLYGFLFALFIIFLRWLWSYLNQLEKEV